MSDSMSKKTPKRFYSQPSLTTYGDLLAITNALAASGKLDGAPFSLKTGGMV